VFPDDDRPVLSALGYTVKAHKPCGEVGPRTIHKAYSPVLSGFSQWLVAQLDPQLRNLAHIAKDSFEFARILEEPLIDPLPANAKMLCIDLKDFFLSGSPALLANDVSSSFPQGPLRSLVHETAFMLLDNQYVAASAVADWYKCIGGSGIGLLHSAAIANLAFYNVCEIRFIDQLRRYGIFKYVRYHDDIFIAFDSMRSLKNFMPVFRTHLGYFKFKAREISSSFVTMLDLDVFLRGGQLHTQPSLDKVPLPLCPSSCHGLQVHRAWPRALANRIHVLSKGDRSCSEKLVSLYEEANAHPFSVAIMQRFRPRVEPRAHDSTFSVMCILRFHPVFKQALGIALKYAPPPASLEFSIRSSWRNGLPSISTMLEKHNANVAAPIRAQQTNNIMGSGSASAENQVEGMLLLPSDTDHSKHYLTNVVKLSSLKLCSQI